MIDVPALAEEVARHLYIEGYRYSEAYPIDRWRARGWPETPSFFKLIDGILLVLRSLDVYKTEKK